MITYIIVSIASGILFGIMDGLIHANPLAQKLYRVYKPIARESLNTVAGIIFEFCYGFIMAGVFLLLYQSLPTEMGLTKGIGFGLMVWVFRVLMYAVSQWMMYKIPGKTIFYTIITGLGEMLVLGALYGLTLKPGG
jgi:hypothetical protein